MVCGVNPRSKLPNAIESATRDGYLLLAPSEKELTTITDNELKLGIFNPISWVEEFMTLGPIYTSVR